MPHNLRFSLALICTLFLASVTTQRLSAAPLILRVGGAGAFKLPDKNATDPTSRANRAIVDAFERENPGIELQGAQGLQISGPAAESSLLLAFAGGSAPDVVYVNFRNSASYISQGFLSPLDEYFKRDPAEFNRLKPEIRKVLQDTGHGHIYSLPYAQFVQAVYYRKDLFQKAGLDPNKPPTTWDEFYTDAQKMTDQNKGIWGFEFGTDPDASAYWWVNFLWQAGGEVIRRNKDGRWEAAFDSPAGVEALEFYKKLMKDPWRGPDGKTYIGVAQHSSTMGLDRAQGKVGMWFAYQSNVIANIADATTMNPSLIGIAPMPKGPTGITANELNAAMWGMSSQIRDPRIKDAAWKFIKFMGSDEADRIRTKAFVEAGLGDTVNPESLEKYGYGDYTTRDSRVWLQTNKTLFLHGHPEPYAENMSQIYVLLGIPLSEIENDPNANPQRLLAAAATEVNTKLTGYVPPLEMQTRRRGAAVIFTLVMCAICVAVGLQIRTLLRDRARRRAEMLYAEAPSGLTLRGHLAAWLFMIPAVLSILVWSYYPLQQGLVIAFQHYRLLGSATYVGLDNFIDVFHQPSFWKGVINSLIFTA
jgi:ABC-type glycerol-3-phosphate transport system substrate-binding protein